MMLCGVTQEFHVPRFRNDSERQYFVHRLENDETIYVLRPSYSTHTRSGWPQNINGFVIFEPMIKNQSIASLGHFGIVEHEIQLNSLKYQRQANSLITYLSIP
jgi:hypothetical protein